MVPIWIIYQLILSCVIKYLYFFFFFCSNAFPMLFIAEHKICNIFLYELEYTFIICQQNVRVGF